MRTPIGAAVSLRLRLLGIIGASLLGVWSLVAVWMLIDVRKEVRGALDDRLAASARMVAGLISQLPPPALANPSDQRIDAALDVIARDGLACEVSLMRGEVTAMQLARTSGSPGMVAAPAGYGNHTFGGRQWRTFVLESGNLRIATADRLDVRDGLLRDIALTAGIPFLLALAASLLLLWFGIGRGLQPLEQLRAALARRRPEDAHALPEMTTPPELRPLVEALQHLLARTHAAIERERRFTDDAAHELRSPLTGIKTHLQVLRLALGRPEHAATAAQSLVDAERGVQALQATLEQLLTLARLDGPAASGCTEPADAQATAHQAILEAGGSDAVQFDASDATVAVAVPAPLLRAALRNLLDNALRHGASTHPVRLTLDRSATGWVCFQVQDRGRGMSEAECAQAVQRFWRHSPGTTGSGLGLPIVMAIAQRYGGSLTLHPAPEQGLVVALTLPVCT
ncbi:ATP-binding protein [Variovorax sp. RHLX14]|uniref:ATP-binding protein n=1 Tax=Variovorax sp. RHLX14 TaxID=1259731 RepID=UPI003F46B68B